MRKISLILIVFILFSLFACSESNKNNNTTINTTLNPTSTISTTSNQITQTPSESLVKNVDDQDLVEYKDTIKHIFFHCLIAYPEIAYTGDVKGKLDQDCVTVLEFKRCLESLYKNNYVLIDINSIYTDESTTSEVIVKKNKIMVPRGKKPLIMSFDDVNYDDKKLDWGMVDKIILDKNNKLASQKTFKNGKVDISYDKEVIPILEDFVEKHPDFSFNGAKGTIAFTGWVGVLGYRTSRDYKNKLDEMEQAKPVVKKLKENGWNFASHGYGHRRSNDITYALFLDDTTKWEKEVVPVIGPTKIYIYPFGQMVKNPGEKYNLLLEKGFRVMCGVSDTTYWKENKDSIFMTRQGVDGYSLRNYGKQLAPLFDTKAVYDTDVRKLNSK